MTSTTFTSFFLHKSNIKDESITQTKLDVLAYQYKYDAHNRQIAKKLPDAGWIYYVYDKADHLYISL